MKYFRQLTAVIYVQAKHLTQFSELYYTVRLYDELIVELCAHIANKNEQTKRKRMNKKSVWTE